MFFCELFCLYFLHVIVSFSHNPVFAHILDDILNLVLILNFLNLS